MSKSVKYRNPKESSESSHFRKPIYPSEPKPLRDPSNGSEPKDGRTPSKNSEPTRPSKPCSASEPSTWRNPQHVSEPVSNSNPRNESEPQGLRNPVGCSEPPNPSNPLCVSGFNREALRQLVEIYYDVQDVRIRSFNRLRQVGEVKGVNPDILKQLENQIKDYIAAEVKDIPIVKVFLKPIKGIGPILSGGLLAWLDPHKAPHASSFWRYCGLHVTNGHAIKREKGKKLDFPLRLRTLTWKVAKSFVRARTPFYRDIYDEAKVIGNEKLRNPIQNPENCPLYKDCVAKLRGKAKRIGTNSKKPPCKLHIDSRAMRKMVKRFLADFWAAWRSLEGLPVSQPYAVAVLHHTSQNPLEAQAALASQCELETRGDKASHLRLETHRSEASHTRLENHSAKASQLILENQRLKASHCSLENHCSKADEVAV